MDGSPPLANSKSTRQSGSSLEKRSHEHDASSDTNSNVFEASARPYGASARKNGLDSMMTGGERSFGGAGKAMAATMSASTSSNARSPAATNAPSRHLVTVLPPSYLPHNPPHPRTSSLCSGYGPPAKFRRGTLVPLYPTLSGQLAAIAREYGLPSTGGLALYLVELNQDSGSSHATHADNALSEALLGGPRIGEEAWALLWGQLFAEDAPYSEDEEVDALGMVSEQQMHTREAQTPSEPMSDVSSSMGESSSAIVNNRSADLSISVQNLSHFSSSSGASPYSNSTRFPKSSATSNTTVEQFDTSSPYMRPHSSASKGKRSHRLGSATRRAGTVQNKPSRSSLGTNRSYSHSITSQDSAVAYGQAVIVGKLEFDIDRGRVGGKWFDSWLASATTEISSSSQSYPRGGTRHPESQLGSLLRSRMPSNESSVPSPTHGTQAEQYGSQLSRTPSYSGRTSPTPAVPTYSGKRGARESLQAVGASSARSASPAVAMSAPLSPAPSRDSIASNRSDLDRQSVASSSIGPVMMEENRQLSTFSTTSSRAAVEEAGRNLVSPPGRPDSRASSRHTKSSSKASLQSAYLPSGADNVSTEPQEAQVRAMSRQSSQSMASDLSSGSDQARSETQFDMLNATPRVRQSQSFHQRSSSSTRSASERQDQGSVSPTPAGSMTQAEPLASYPMRDQAAQAEQIDSNSLRSSSAAASPERRQRQESHISARSGASSASFEAVSEDEVEVPGAAYQALADEDDAGSNEQVTDNIPPKVSSPSDGSQYGEATEPSEGMASPDMNQALQKDPLRDMFESDAVTWADIRASQIEEQRNSPIPELHTSHRSEDPSPAAGLGILSPNAYHAAIPQSASSASFDPFEFDNEGRSPSPSRAEDTGENADVEEVVGLLKTHPVPNSHGLSSPINLGESKPAVPMPAGEGINGSDNHENDFVAAIEERRSSVNHTRTASIASSSYSRRAHSRKSSSISIVRHSRHDSTASSKKAPLSPIPSPTPVMVPLPESDSNFSLASTAQSFPSISEPASDFVAPARLGNRTAGLPSDWASQLSAFPGLRSRANTDATAFPPSTANAATEADETVVEPADADAVEEVPGPTPVQPQLGTDALLTPNNARDSLARFEEGDITRSRSSSIEMMENLDDLEKALAELSPRSAKTARQAMPMPDLRPMFPLNKSVAATPGYDSKSEQELAAPSTPVTAAEASQVAVSNATPAANALGPVEQPAIVSAPPRGASLPPATPQAVAATNEPSPPLPPLPLNIKPRETPLSPDNISLASTTLPYASQATPLPTPPIQKVTFGELQEPTPIQPMVERREVTFAPSPQKVMDDETPSSARSVGSRFAGASLKLKNWSSKGKTDQSDNSPVQFAPVQSPAPGASEPNKSPLGGFKGLSFWRQKDNEDANQAEATLPMSPATSQAGSVPTPSSGGGGARIPRKSSLASLKSAMLSRSESASPGLGAAPQIPLPSPANTSYSAFPSPPTHTSLPSPPVRTNEYQSFMPSFPPPPPIASYGAPGTPPALYRGDSSTVSTSDSPQSQRAGIGLNSMSDLPAFSSIRNRRDLDSTPDMQDLRGGRFLGYEGRFEGHVSSAPTTPAYAEPSVVSSSGRLGKPVKANAAKTQFRLSADADLTKMMSHMQAIEFGEDAISAGPTPRTSKADFTKLTGLGLGLPNDKRT